MPAANLDQCKFNWINSLLKSSHSNYWIETTIQGYHCTSTNKERSLLYDNESWLESSVNAWQAGGGAGGEQVGQGDREDDGWSWMITYEWSTKLVLDLLLFFRFVLICSLESIKSTAACFFTFIFTFILVKKCPAKEKWKDLVVGMVVVMVVVMVAAR